MERLFPPLGAEDVGAGETGAPSLFFFFLTNLVFLACISALANTCVGWESGRSGAGRRQMMGMSLKGTGLNPPPRKATKQGNWGNKTKWRRSWTGAWRGAWRVSVRNVAGGLGRLYVIPGASSLDF